ncbi:IS5 family transposase [Methylomonas sp. AM2-LC]|uniref:IS5 family transposase n=1 Tax=Methylomonas sp. AM2-LC TaxID=3153301 RepID=UPI003266CE4D
MRGQDIQQEEWFSYKTLEERVPVNHPLRTVQVLTNGILKSMDSEFEKLYSRNGRPSIPPERLLRAILIQIFYTVRSERQLMEQLDFNLLFRWFVGLNMDEAVWDHSTFSQNRDRLLTESLTRDFFNRVVAAAGGYGLLSDEHFSVDGTLIEAWASQKSFQSKDGKGKSDDNQDGGNKRDPQIDFKGELRCNDTHASTTDPETMLYRKGKGKEARLSYMAHALMENRHGLVVGVETTQATGTAEREAATKMCKWNVNPESTLGADKGYDVKEFVNELQLQGINPHIARNITEKRSSAIAEEITHEPGYAISLRIRKRIEQIFGWSKTIGPMRKTKLRGLTNVATQTLLTFAAYNLVRLRKLLCLQPITAQA